jgi:glycerophosphodiester phosphodiesterase
VLARQLTWLVCIPKNLCTKKVPGLTWCKAFLFALDRNIENVDTFFNKRLADAHRRLKSLRSRYEDHFDLTPASENISTNGSVHSEDLGSDNATKTVEGYGLDRDEIEEILGALLELRGMLRKIQWYGEVNRRGFIKILKK